MAFDLTTNTNFVTQTGTDADLSALASLTGIEVITSGTRTFYKLPGGRALRVQGTLSFQATEEGIIGSNTATGTGSGLSAGGIEIQSSGVLNIEGRIHSSITDASQVTSDVSGATNSMLTAYFFEGVSRIWHGSLGATNCGAVTIKGGGTLNATAVTIFEGRGSMAFDVSSLGSIKDCRVIINDTTHPSILAEQALPGNRGYLTRLRSAAFNFDGYEAVGGGFIVQSQRAAATSPGQFSGFIGAQSASNEGALWENNANNNFNIDNPTFVNCPVAIAAQSNDVSGTGTEDRMHAFVNNAADGTETVIRPIDGGSQGIYVNIGKNISVSAMEFGGTAADTQGTLVFIKDSPSNVSSTNSQDAGTFVFGTVDGTSITNQAENATIEYFETLGSTGELSENIRVTTGILDIAKGTAQNTTYDTGTSSIDRRGDASTTTYNSADKLKDEFTVYSYQAKYNVQQETAALKGNGILALEPVMFLDSDYSSTAFGTRVTVANLDEMYDAVKQLKATTAAEFQQPTESTLYASNSAGLLDVGSRAITASTGGSALFAATSSTFAVNVSTVLTSGTKFSGLKTSGSVDLSNINLATIEVQAATGTNLPTTIPTGFNSTFTHNISSNTTITVEEGADVSGLTITRTAGAVLTIVGARRGDFASVPALTGTIEAFTHTVEIDTSAVGACFYRVLHDDITDFEILGAGSSGTIAAGADSHTITLDSTVVTALKRNEALVVCVTAADGNDLRYVTTAQNITEGIAISRDPTYNSGSGSNSDITGSYNVSTNLYTIQVLAGVDEGAAVYNKSIGLLKTSQNYCDWIARDGLTNSITHSSTINTTLPINAGNVRIATAKDGSVFTAVQIQGVTSDNSTPITSLTSPVVFIPGTETSTDSTLSVSIGLTIKGSSEVDYAEVGSTVKGIIQEPLKRISLSIPVSDSDF